jgi:GT2 family glycosyltransferase
MIPDLSVIILSYNHFAETTGPCLASLARVRDLDLELIVVDNGSDDPTRSALAEAARQDGRIRLILHEKNRGYAGGNNDGVAAAASDLIVLLNSDTRVLENSLSLLVRELRAAPASLVLGPVTNAAGTEQQIFCHGGTVEEILQQGTRWSENGRGSFFSTDQLTFFCVAMGRRTYLDLGGLDESFGIGFYEDADFCRRATDESVSLKVMEESFVYHQGSASFAGEQEKVRRLLRENRRRFEKKHGKTREIHVREKNLRILQGYCTEAGVAHGFSPSLAYRFTNRIRRAQELMPNSFLKKLPYRSRIKQIKETASQLGIRQEVE